MIKKIFLLLLFITQTVCHAQNKNSIWCFGDSAGIDFRNIFNPVSISSALDGRGSCASISDSAGNLLFYAGFDYTLTVHLYNSLNDTLLNSSYIDGDGAYNGIVTILPVPADSDLYYLFCRTGPSRICHYNIIYPAYNNNEGIVLQKNILLDSLIIGDCVTAIKHGNGRDWWLINKYSNPATSYNRFFIYLITADSICPPLIQDFNNARDGDLQKIIWHPSYNKFMLINPGGYMGEYWFDRCTGAINLIQTIFPQQTSNYNRLFWEGSYSPNGNLFYASTDDIPSFLTMYLLQFDLTAANISTAIDTLEVWPTLNISTGAVRLAPDNKIYFSRWYLCNSSQPYCWPYPDSVRNYVNENLSIINSPDSLGSACNYQPFSFYLGGKRTYAGLPNNPNYELGPLVGSACDSLTVSINSPNVLSTTGTLSVVYYSMSQTAYINAQHLKGKLAVLFIYDVTGQLVYQTNVYVYHGYCTFDFNISSYAKGLYIVSLQTEKENLVKKFVKN